MHVMICIENYIQFHAGYFVRWTLLCKKMRRAGYVTVLDPFQERYDRVMTSLMYIPPLMRDVFWSGAIL